MMEVSFKKKWWKLSRIYYSVIRNSNTTRFVVCH